MVGLFEIRFHVSSGTRSIISLSARMKIGKIEGYSLSRRKLLNGASESAWAARAHAAAPTSRWIWKGQCLDPPEASVD